MARRFLAEPQPIAEATTVLLRDPSRNWPRRRMLRKLTRQPDHPLYRIEAVPHARIGRYSGFFVEPATEQVYRHRVDRPALLRAPGAEPSVEIVGDVDRRLYGS